MLFKWVIAESLMTVTKDVDSHGSIWKLEFETMNDYGCYGTVVATVQNPNRYRVGSRMRVQWPSPNWQQIDELEEFVRKTRAAAGIGE